MPEQVSSYRLGGEIARGGMGIVYRGVHTVFEEVVAIKAIFPELTLNPELRARFVNEAKIQRRLQHPNIVQIREFLIDQGRFYIVMELIEGETLAERLKRLAAPLRAKEALEIFREALQGLGFAHAQGVIHRDMKPSNIMLTREGVAKLTDFGIARDVGVPGLTRTGTVLGTPAYMAPEQVQGHQVDKRSDIYSLGVTLYEMVAGRVPFEKPKHSDSDYPVLRAHIEEPPLPPSRLVPSIPPFIEAAILKAMAKQPDERFASCEEFGAALVPEELPATKRVVPAAPPSVAPRESIRARAPTPKEVVPRRAPARKRTESWVAELFGMLTVLLVVGTAGVMVYRMIEESLPNRKSPATRQTSPAPAVDRPAERPGPVPSQPLPAQPSAAELAAQAQALIKQANAALDRGEYDGAISNYRRALELDATNQQARAGIDRARSAKAAELSPIAAQQRLYTVEDLKKFAQAGVTEKRFHDLVKQRGIDFTPTSEVLDRLRQSGVPESVLAQVRELIPPYRPYTLKQTLRGHQDAVFSVAFSPDGQLLASGCHDKTIKVWEPQSGQLLRTLEGHTARVEPVAFSPDGQLLASGSEDKTIKLWDPKSGQLLRTLEGHRGGVWSVPFSPNGQLLASASYDATIKLWEVSSDRLLRTLERCHTLTTACLSWEVSSGRLLRTLTGHSSNVLEVAFSPDGRLLASGSVDNTVKLWDVASGALKQTLSGHQEEVWSVAFSPDGRLLASGSGDNTVKLWDVASGALKQTLGGHQEAVYSVAFSPDGRLLASGSGGNTVKLWDVASGALKQTLSGHQEAVYSVAFSPDGRLLASGSYDKTIKLWERAP